MVVDSLAQTWPPFVLVAGLLLVGRVANEDGVFEALGACLAGARLSPRELLVSLLALVAAVTAVLNLDTSVVFMTPVLVHAARRRGLDEKAFLYGAVFMSNSASLLLPGSNLTNLIVLGREHVDGLALARQMVLPWLAACAITIGLVAVFFRLDPARPGPVAAPPLRVGVGAGAVLAAAALIVVLPRPELPVLGVGLAACAFRRLRPRLDVRVLSLLFGLAVALGVVARAYDGPARLLGHAGRWWTAAVAAVGANALNNLPAAALFSAHEPSHPRALLLGLDLGPNLAVTGSLSAYLWLQAAKGVGSRPSILTYSRLGAVLVPATLAAGVFAAGAILTRS